MRRKITRKKSTSKFKAIPYTYKGIKFKSKLEVFMYKQLEDLKVKFDYEGTTFTVMEGFVYQDEKIRPIKYTPDFVLKDHPVVIETKGFPGAAFPLRMKLFKHSLHCYNDERDIFIPHNQKECLAVIQEIKRKYL